jgi:hypothetical protein
LRPEAVVQRQLDAYNARDLDAFLAQYSPEVRLYRPPAAEPVMVGRDAVAAFHATQRFHLPNLHAELVNRMVLGNKVVDHERVSGIRESPFEVAVVYEVKNGLIVASWTYLAE